MSVVMLEGEMRLELSRWGDAQAIGVCRECCGPIGGWNVTAPFFAGPSVHWHHLDECDTLDGHEADPIAGQVARFEGRVWCGGSGDSGIRTWVALAARVDYWTRHAGQPVTWSGVWRDDAGRVLGGMRGEVPGCVHVAHRTRCELHGMVSCAICHACMSRPV